jgi:hypothetical protein
LTEEEEEEELLVAVRGILEAGKAERGKEEGHCVCVCVCVCVHNDQVAGPAGAVAGLRAASQLVFRISQFEIFVLRFSQVECCLWGSEEGV